MPERRDYMNNDEKIKELLEAEEIPEEISPENIKAMLDAKAAEADRSADEAAVKKRSGIRIGGRIAAAAAACALIAGGGAALKNSDMLSKNTTVPETTSGHNDTVKSEDDRKKSVEDDVKGEDAISPENDKPETVSGKAVSFMSGAKSYDDIYSIFRKSTKKYEKSLEKKNREGLIFEADEAEVAPAADDYSVTNNDASSAAGTLGIGGADEQEDFYETFDQEEGVREADIVKTDGKNIYTVYNYSKGSDIDLEDYYTDNAFAYLTIAPVNKGDIGEIKQISLNDNIGSLYGDSYTEGISVQDMYIYNDLIAVVGTVSGWKYDEDIPSAYWHRSDNKSSVFVSFYTHADDPEYLGTYYQNGYYSDVRITPDGYMYLISDYNSAEFNNIEDPENIERYIPACGTDAEGLSCIEPGCILLPDEQPEDWLLRYKVIGSIDLSVPGQYSVCETKAIAGFSGTIYCSADNIYTASGYDQTELTRIAVSGGRIEPAASCRLNGYVLDQFSMSEYNGYFRIATSENRWRTRGNIITDAFGWTEEGPIRNNHVYVLDMALSTVGSISDFGIDENIKSVNFSGDIAYVVTYRQTDPLFAIDLSDPAAPSIMDELKLPGFSTYMQKWDDDHLLGFGIDATEDGIQTGIKAVMFDNSDPNDLKEAGRYAINNETDHSWVSSYGVNERKALLIAPEKNLFGFPATIYDYGDGYDKFRLYSKYVFLSYDGSQFVLRGEIADDHEDDGSWYSLERALYIGDYIYTVSGDRIIAAAIDDISITDTAVIKPDLG